MDQQTPPKEHRPPVNLRIKFRSETVEQFIERYAVDVSRGGIFIRTRDPLAVGTQLKLDFQFQSGTPLMSGDGTVVWIREPDPNRANVPPGMGVRFDKLTPESQAVLEQLLAEKSKRERGAVPGSSASSAGLAVRRASSMFSALEPQVSVSDRAAEKSASAAPTEAGNQEPTSPRAVPSVRPAAPAATAEAAPSLPPTRPTTTTPPKSISGLDALLGPRAHKHPTPSGGAGAFDDGEEPTQIAGRLPSFLTSDEEATTVGVSPRDSEAAARASASESSLPGIGRVVELRPKTAATAAATPATGAASPSGEAAPHGAGAETTRDVAKDILSVAGESATAAKTSAVGAVASAPTPEAKSSDAKGSGARGSIEGKSAGPHAKGAHHADKSGEKRPRAVLVFGTVVVLGVVAVFVSRFFGSQATETATPAGGGSPSMGAPAGSATGSATTGSGTTSLPTAGSATAPAAEPTVAAANPGAAAGTATAPGTATPPTTLPAAAATPEPTIPAAAPSAPQANAAAGAPSPAAAALANSKKVIKKKVAHAGHDGADDATAKPAGKSPAGGGTTTAAAAAAVKTGDATGAAAAGTPAAAAGASAAAATADDSAAEAGHEVRVTSKPIGADVSVDGVSVGKTPYAGSIADVSAPHAITVKKDGFEPFEQMIGASSAWTKTKLPKGKPGPQVLKITAKLKQVGGAEAKEPNAPSAESAPKAEVARPDRPLPPSEEGAAAKEPPP